MLMGTLIGVPIHQISSRAIYIYIYILRTWRPCDIATSVLTDLSKLYTAACVCYCDAETDSEEASFSHETIGINHASEWNRLQCITAEQPVSDLHDCKIWISMKQIVGIGYEVYYSNHCMKISMRSELKLGSLLLLRIVRILTSWNLSVCSY